MSGIMPIQQSQSSKRRFPLRTFAAVFVFSLLALVFSGLRSWQIHERIEEMSRRHITLTEDIGRIMLFDEVLTMSARMAAGTGDFSYEKRYDQFDPLLTAKLDELRVTLPQAEIALFVKETDEANNALVKIERQAFALAHQGKRQEAMALLTGDEYLRLKKIYAGGMEKTVNVANRLIEKDVRQLHYIFLWFAAAGTVGILVFLAMWFFAARSARSWAAERREAEGALQMAHDELEVRVEQRTADLLSANEQLQREISERKQAVEKLRIASLKHQLLFESSRDALMTLAPPSWKFTGANQATLQLFGVPSVAEFTALGPWNISPEQQPDGRPSGEKAQEAIATAMREGSNFFEWEHQRLDGQPFAADVLLTRMEVGEEVFLQATVRDISERKQTEKKLQQLAHNDTLTGLPNRALFRDRLEHGLALAQRHKQGLAVLFLDLDHFKEINDTLGHDMGDVLLRETASRLLACVRKSDTVARMGGDEFTVILTGTKTPEYAEQVAKKILKALQEPFELNGTLRNVGCSIGIARYPEHGADSETLLKNADAAMYHAKKKRNTFCSFL